MNNQNAKVHSEKRACLQVLLGLCIQLVNRVNRFSTTFPCTHPRERGVSAKRFTLFTPFTPNKLEKENED